jgi:hypothetical protein
MVMHTRSIVFVMVAACSYRPLDSTDGGGGGGPDGGSGSNRCQAPSSYGAATVSQESGAYFPSSSTAPDEVGYAGAIAAKDVLTLWLLDGEPPFASGFEPGMFDLSGQNALTSCGTCVLIAADCNNCNVSNGQGVGSWYIANAGTLTLTTFTTSNIAGKLANATLTHVDIDFTNGATTAAGDGCTTHVTSVSFSAALAQH